MGLEELRALIASMGEEVRGLLDAKKTEEAKMKMEELRGLKEQLKIAEELEEDEKRGLQSQRKMSDLGTGAEKVDEMRALVKFVMGEKLSEEERGSIKSADNAPVIPKQFVNQLQEYKKGFGSLKEYCDVIQVNKNEGTIPIANLDQNTFPEVAEGDNIIDGGLVTTEKTFKCAKHGLIQSLTSELVDDAEVEIEGLVRKNFAEIVTVAENTKITKILKDNAVEYAGATGYEDIDQAIDKAVPGVRNGLATFTNVDGFAYLKNLKDSEKRPLNLVTELNGKYYYHGKELVVVDNTLLPATIGKKVFYVCNPREMIKYCDRKAVTIARSTEAGFNDDTVKLRILERFAVITGVVRHCYKIEF